ncbi:unnamed protein product [Lactuca saligna]|uniref:Uncharacterized protein n=1 Tax=Lactuca saligna TaxID=75948 RepID=A0AA36EAY6_LACSI|nr:unnamed protein product [Lactuca saligna]
MEWKKCYLDMILVPLSFMITIGYHLWLWQKVRTKPLSTIIGTNNYGRRLWVSTIMKDNEKKNILAVQTLRNTIMGATLMATTSILLCSELLEKGFTLNAMGNRIFYSALPLMLWIFGPVLVFVCSITMVPMLYNLDFVFGKSKEKMDEIPNVV